MNFLKTWLIANITPFLKAIKSAISTAKTEAINSAKTYTDDTAATTLQSAKSYTDTKLSQLDVLGEYKGSGATVADLNALSGVGKGDLAILTAKDGSNKPGIYVFNDTTSSFEFVIEIKSADAQALVDGVLTKIGDLADLTTTQKSTLVGAINELVDRLDGIDNTTQALSNQISDESNRAGAAENALSERIDNIFNGTFTDVSVDLDAIEAFNSAIDNLNFQTIDSFSNDKDSKAIKVDFFRAILRNIVGKMSILNNSLASKADKEGSNSQKFLVADASAQTKQAVNASQFDFTITDAEAQTAWTNA